MLEFLRFALESPTNFLGTTFFIVLFYGVFGSASINVFKDFLSYRQVQANTAASVQKEELAVQKLRQENTAAAYAQLNKE